MCPKLHRLCRPEPAQAHSQPQANGHWPSGKIFSSGQKRDAQPRPAAAPSETIAGRAIEQGALLVAAPAEGSIVVLQMPRGNLEAVQPRVLGRAALAALLEVRPSQS